MNIIRSLNRKMDGLFLTHFDTDCQLSGGESRKKKIQIEVITCTLQTKPPTKKENKVLQFDQGELHWATAMKG